jgi:hypothetical protein
MVMMMMMVGVSLLLLTAVNEKGKDDERTKQGKVGKLINPVEWNRSSRRRQSI